MTEEPQTVKLDGSTYAWTEHGWSDMSTNMAPPKALVHRLNTVLCAQLETSDATISNSQQLMKEAIHARDHDQDERATRLASRALELDPDNTAAAAVLCSTLRAAGKAKQALEATEHLAARASAPLRTSRAAALCDVGRWEDAKQEISRALAMGGSPHAFAVVRSIKLARPNLYD